MYPCDGSAFLDFAKYTDMMKSILIKSSQKIKKKLISGELCKSGVIARFCLRTVDDRRGIFLSIQLTQDDDTQRNGQHLRGSETQTVIVSSYVYTIQLQF